MHATLKKHFDKTNFSLEHPNPTRFASGPWHTGSGPPVHVLFVIYRLLLSSAFTGLIIWSICMNWDGGLWLCYLTNWGFTICTATSYFGTAIVLTKYVRQKSLSSSSDDLKPNDEYMPVGYKMYWAIYNISMSAAFFITILYWSLLFNPEVEAIRGGFGLDFTVHGLNSILSLIELMVGGLPMRLMHFYHSVIFSATYIIFNLIYWAAGGKGRQGSDYIYPVLDWDNKPGLGVGIIFGGALLLTVLHTCACCLSGLRSRLANKRKSHAVVNLAGVRPPDLETGNDNKAFVMQF